MAEYRVIKIEEIEPTKSFIESHYEKVKNEASRADFEKVIKGADKALELLEGDHFDNEKATYLFATLTLYANQLAFALFRQDEMTKEIEEEYRALESADNTSAWVQEYLNTDKEEMERIQQEQINYTEHVKDIDVFKAVISGMRFEEAKQKQAEQEEKIRQAQGIK